MSGAGAIRAEAGAIVAIAGVLVMLGACGRGPPGGAPADLKVDLTVTLDPARRKCVVALHSEAQGSIVACGEVASFVQDELRLPGNATFAVRMSPGGDEAEAGRVCASLRGAGYRPADATAGQPCMARP
jgi:hypothetical protein